MRYVFGFVGLGKMGWGMASILYERIYSPSGLSLDDGVIRELVVYDIDREQVSGFIDKHPKAKSAAGLEQVGENSDIVWMMVPYHSVHEVFSTLLEHMGRGRIMIDGGNSDPRASIRHAQEARKRGIFFVDVGCSGGPYRVGKLSLMVGCEKELYQKLLPILRLFGEPFYVGSNGAGHLVKMLHNDLSYIVMAGISEVALWLMKLASQFLGSEVDVITALKAMNEGLAQSRLLQLTIEVLEEKLESINNVEPLVLGGDHAVWTLEMSGDFPLPLITLTLLLRELSRGQSYDARLEKLLRDIKCLEGGRDERFSIQALLRNKFGGHPIIAKSR